MHTRRGALASRTASRRCSNADKRYDAFIRNGEMLQVNKRKREKNHGNWVLSLYYLRKCVLPSIIPYFPSRNMQVNLTTWATIETRCLDREGPTAWVSPDVQDALCLQELETGNTRLFPIFADTHFQWLCGRQE